MKKLVVTDGINEMTITRAENDPTGNGTNYYVIQTRKLPQSTMTLRIVTYSKLMDEIYSIFCESL